MFPQEAKVFQKHSLQVQPELWMRCDAHDGNQDLSGVLAMPRVVAHADKDDTGLVVSWEDILINLVNVRLCDS